MALRGAVPLGTPDPRGVRLQRSRVQPWRQIPLLWGAANHRSMLLYAIFISGTFAGFALPSMVTQPPDFFTLESLRYLACVLFAAGIVVAPTDAAHRGYALLALVAFTLMVRPRSLIAAEQLDFQVTYGTQDALRFASIGALLMYWIALRMRHPISSVVTAAVYSLVGGLHFLFGSSFWRAVAVPEGVSESDVSFDEAFIWSMTLILTVPMLFLCSWIDQYIRNAVPLYGIDYRARMHEHDPRTPVRFTQAWVAFWLFIDIWAIERVSRVLRAPATLKGDREWYARTLLSIASGRLIVVMLSLVAIAILLINDTYRPF